MTHVHFPDFSQSLRPIAYDADRLPFHSDPILAAIDRHSEAWSVFQVAPEGEASETADAETFDSLHALLATPCATRTGMLCLIRHLRWWLTEAEIRDRLGTALQTALDAADHIIAVLDRMDGDPDREDGGDAEPSLGAPENHHGSQIVWLRGNDQDGEAEAPEVVLPDVAAEPKPWGGRGNVLAAAGIVLLDMVAGR